MGASAAAREALRCRACWISSPAASTPVARVPFERALEGPDASLHLPALQLPEADVLVIRRPPRRRPSNRPKPEHGRPQSSPTDGSHRGGDSPAPDPAQPGTRREAPDVPGLRDDRDHEAQDRPDGDVAALALGELRARVGARDGDDEADQEQDEDVHGASRSPGGISHDHRSGRAEEWPEGIRTPAAALNGARGVGDATGSAGDGHRLLLPAPEDRHDTATRTGLRSAPVADDGRLAGGHRPRRRGRGGRTR